MHELYTYHIEVLGELEVNTVNATSPLQITVVRADPVSTLLTIHADQSGLIGLLRHLHGWGFVFLSVICER